MHLIIGTMNYDGNMREDISEPKVKRPVNRWLELKNDETMEILIRRC